MWILPKNYPLSSHFAQAMLERKEDLTLQGLNIESSLMWRSKPSPLRTWLTRWKPTSYLPALYGAILKPCQWNAFETELTSSLAVIRVSHLAQQDSEKEKTTPDTCGLTLGDTSNQLDLFSASLKTSKDISALDSEKSLATWKALVTSARGEYLVRVKLAHLTKEKESTSWPTPSARDHKGGYQGGRIRNGKVSLDTLDVAVQHYSGDKTKVGHLNPTWVEWLMGVPTGWTELGCWGMELCHKQPQKHGSHSTKELRH